MKKTIQQFVLAAVLLLLSSQMQAQFVIGKDTLGGKVGYIDASGVHGLIVGPRSFAPWGCYSISITGANYADGLTNSNAIVAQCTVSGIAARLCRDYRGGGLADWYLPSLEELKLLYSKKDALGDYNGDSYWSSTHGNATLAWKKDFNYGGEGGASKQVNESYRPVRKF